MAEQGGLLDFLNSPGGMGLLSAVGAGLAGARRGGTWNAVGSGLLGGVQGYAQGQELQRQNEFATQRGKLFDMQAQQLEQAQAAAKAEAERQAARDAYLGGVGKVTSPRLDAQPNQADPRQMLGLGFDPKFIETYMNAGNLGKAKIKDFKEIRNPDGTVSVVGFDEFGNVTNTKQTPFKAPDVRDFGGYVGGVDPITGKVTNYGQKTMTPDGLAADRRAREAATRESMSVTYQTDGSGNLVAVPNRVQPGAPVQSIPVMGPNGAPMAGKPSEAVAKERMSINQQRAAIQGALNAVKETPSAFSLGRGLATLSGTVPESIAGRTDSDAERKARAFVFNNVSATINERAGAAQSAQEMARLRSFLPGETDNAAQIQSKLEGFLGYLDEREKGIGGKPSAPSGGPAVGEVRKGYRFKGGNPSDPKNWEKV